MTHETYFWAYLILAFCTIAVPFAVGVGYLVRFLSTKDRRQLWLGFIIGLLVPVLVSLSYYAWYRWEEHRVEKSSVY